MSIQQTKMHWLGKNAKRKPKESLNIIGENPTNNAVIINPNLLISRKIEP